MRIVLASGSPSRLRLLRAAGVDPTVVASGVPEDDVDPTDPATMVAILACRKAEAVAARIRGDGGGDGIVIGADSTLELGGEAHGKPASAADAAERWRRMRGGAGALLTGHHLIDLGSRRAAAGVARTVVHFGSPTDAEIDAYVATGEPFAAAGAFTLDGYGAAFVERIDGEPSNVIGLSLPLVRRLVGDLGVGWTSLWQ